MAARPPVRETLKNLGLAPSKSRGQNFLKDPGLIGAIVAAIVKEAGDVAPLLEIGPGLGALTFPLLEAGRSVTAVELDRGLAENLAQAAPGYGGRLKIIHQDILAVDPGPLAESSGGPLFVCGNLPYNISSPALFWFMEHRRRFTGAMFMLQKEMADRLTAQAATKDYGRLTAAVSLWCRVRKVMAVPPSAFHPRPKVESAIVAIRPRPENQWPQVTPEGFGRFTAQAFAARRKTIFNNLARAYGRERASAALAAQGLNPGARAETLPPEELAALARQLEQGATP